MQVEQKKFTVDQMITGMAEYRKRLTEAPADFGVHGEISHEQYARDVVSYLVSIIEEQTEG